MMNQMKRQIVSDPDRFGRVFIAAIDAALNTCTGSKGSEGL